MPSTYVRRLLGILVGSSLQSVKLCLKICVDLRFEPGAISVGSSIELVIIDVYMNNDHAGVTIKNVLPKK